MQKIKFINRSHELNYASCVIKTKSMNDPYRKALFYLLTLDTATFEHINAIYDFKENCINPESINAPWQNCNSKKTTRLAFNLYNGMCVDKIVEGESIEGTECYYAVDNIFCCEYALFYMEAIKIRYQEYVGGIIFA